MPTTTVPRFSRFRLRALRAEAGLSRDRLAVKAGLHHVTVWRLEKEDRVPDADTLGRLAAALGCSVADLFDGDAQ